MALDPQTSVEQIIAALVCGLEEYAFDWFKLMVETTTDPVANRALRMILRDEVRHCAFGWHFIESRLPHMSADEIERMRKAFIDTTVNVELTGYRVPWLAPDSPVTDEENRIDRLTRAAGLGASIEAEEKPVFVACVGAGAQALRRARHRDPAVHASEARHVLGADDGAGPHPPGVPLPAAPRAGGAEHLGALQPRKGEPLGSVALDRLGELRRRPPRGACARGGAPRLEPPRVAALRPPLGDAVAARALLPRAAARERSEVLPVAARQRGGVAPRRLPRLRRAPRRLHRGAGEPRIRTPLQPDAAPRGARRRPRLSTPTSAPTLRCASSSRRRCSRRRSPRRASRRWRRRSS